MQKTPTTYSTQNAHPMWPPQVLSKDPSYCEYMVNQVLTSDDKAEDNVWQWISFSEIFVM